MRFVSDSISEIQPDCCNSDEICRNSVLVVLSEISSLTIVSMQRISTSICLDDLLCMKLSPLLATNNSQAYTYEAL